MNSYATTTTINTRAVPCVTPPSVRQSMLELHSLSIPSLSPPQQERRIRKKRPSRSIECGSMNEVHQAYIGVNDVSYPLSPPRIQNSFQASGEPFELQLRKGELLASHLDNNTSENARLPSGPCASPKSSPKHLQNPPTLKRKKTRRTLADFSKENESYFFLPELILSEPLSFNESLPELKKKHPSCSPASVQWSP